MNMQAALFAQFGHPRGVLGHLAGIIMARRASNRARNRWTIELLDIVPDDRVLEIGCGPGFAVAEAAKRIEAGKIVGIDHSAVMIAQAIHRNRAAVTAGRVELVTVPLENLPPSAGLFDKAYSANVIQFIAEKRAFFAALRERLRPGALVATTFMPRQRGATRADALAMADAIAAAMRQIGFQSIEVKELPLEPMPAVSVLGRRGPDAVAN